MLPVKPMLLNLLKKIKANYLVKICQMPKETKFPLELDIKDKQETKEVNYQEDKNKEQLLPELLSKNLIFYYQMKPLQLQIPKTKKLFKKVQIKLCKIKQLQLSPTEFLLSKIPIKLLLLKKEILQNKEITNNYNNKKDISIDQKEEMLTD